MLKKLVLTAVMLAAIVLPVYAQRVINGSEVFVPGGWIGTQVPNAGVTGTTLNKTAKLTGTGTAVIATTTDTSGVIGIVGSGAGTTGNAGIVQSGQVSCVFDGPTTANDYVIESVTVNGDCADGGSSTPSAQSFGRVLSTNVGGGTYAILVTLRSAGGVTVASGTAALGTSAIANGACAAVVTVSAPGVATTDTIITTPNADITAVTGYAVGSSTLVIYPYPTSGNVNYKVCNSTGASITPGAVTLNWRVVR